MNNLIKAILVIVTLIIVSTLIGKIVFDGKCNDTNNEIFADQSCTKIKTYKSENLTDKPQLVIVLHGDSPNKKPDYQYKFAKLVASQNLNVVAIGMLRPGYTDPLGSTSNGIKGKANGDSYDAKRIDQIASAVQELKKTHSPFKTILAGHSGGSAITANIMSLYPGLVDHAFIVSCPCDVKTWRKDMLALSKKPVFSGELDTLSPIDLVDQIKENTEISLFVGNKDKITQPILSEKYKQAAQANGVNVSLKIIDGKHDIFLNPEILNEMSQIIDKYNQ